MPLSFNESFIAAFIQKSALKSPVDELAANASNLIFGGLRFHCNRVPWQNMTIPYPLFSSAAHWTAMYLAFLSSIKHGHHAGWLTKLLPVHLFLLFVEIV